MSFFSSAEFGSPDDDFGRLCAIDCVEMIPRLKKTKQDALPGVLDGRGGPLSMRASTRYCLVMVQHAESHLLLLGRQTSLEKVAAFLCEMDSRLSSSAMMTLPMFRRDIADYLGLSLETVSRAFSMLRDRGILSFKSQTQREIVLLDRSKLARLVDQPAHKLV